MKVIALFVVTTGCSTAPVERSPSYSSATDIKLMDQKNPETFAIDRDFQSTHSQDVKVCGELHTVEKDFYVRSQCSHPEKIEGVSKVPSDVLLPEGQRTVWTSWSGTAKVKNEGAKKHFVPFVCFVGRGNGDPCDKKSGSVIQRVRRFTTDEKQFNSW